MRGVSVAKAPVTDLFEDEGACQENSQNTAVNAAFNTTAVIVYVTRLSPVALNQIVDAVVERIKYIR